MIDLSDIIRDQIQICECTSSKSMLFLKHQKYISFHFKGKDYF